MLNNLPGGVTHLAELILALAWGLCHRQDYRRQKAVGSWSSRLSATRFNSLPFEPEPHQPTRNSLTQFSIVSRNSRRRPSKKWSAPSIRTSFFGSAKEFTNCSIFTRGPN